MSEGLSVKAEAQKDVPGYGKNVKITISASHKTSIIIEITNEQNEIMNTLNCNTTKEFKCQTFWSVPRDTIPGEYTIRAFDSISESQVKFLLK
jgi:hypothetical protein